MGEFLYDIAPYVGGFLLSAAWLYVKGKTLEEDYYDEN